MDTDTDTPTQSQTQTKNQIDIMKKLVEDESREMENERRLEKKRKRVRKIIKETVSECKYKGNTDPLECIRLIREKLKDDDEKMFFMNVANKINEYFEDLD